MNGPKDGVGVGEGAGVDVGGGVGVTVGSAGGGAHAVKKQTMHNANNAYKIFGVLFI